MILDFPLYILIIAAVFAVAWFIQLIYLLLIPRAVVSRCKSEKRKEDVSFTNDQPGVSVVVYAHNQGDALLRNLPVILDNDYPNFEVIVVDDMSNDDTEDVLTLLEQRSENIFHTKLTDKVRTMSHRKLALLLGVKAAHNDIVLMTKAQCVPKSRNWISSMTRNFTQEKEIVIGPVAFEGRTGIISRFYQYDLFQRMVFMFGMALTFRAFAGWGTNMAIRKQIVFADNNRAFSKHLFIHLGEDDLLVGEMARRNNVAVECTADAMIFDQDSPLKTAWSKDRLNRAFTGKRYSFGSKFMKHLDTVTRYLCVLPGIALIVIATFTQAWIPLAVVCSLLLIRMILQAVFTFITSKNLGIHRYFFSPIVYELFTPIIDSWYWLRASVHNKGFYVSRV